ncbi:MAG TPA: glycosyltransferase family 9 protein [Blastocatellia bacterium]|nr:glycosyltransferase family 9 protein [Blastocatellia bacterium]
MVATGLLGDTIMSTPVIIEARRLWPHAEITLLGRRRNCELLSACPAIDHFKEAASLPFSLRGAAGVKALKDWTAAQSFDVAIILLGDEFAYLLAEANIPVRVGVRGHLLEPCLTHTYDIGSPRTWGPGERLNAIRCLGFDVPDSLPRLWVSDTARESARRILSELGMDSSERYIALHPFGSTRYQWWPPERARQLADGLWSEQGLKTIIIDGPETRDYATEISTGNLLATPALLEVQELLALIEGAALVVSTDSGPFHIAGALGRPLLGLFRSTRPEHAQRYPQAQVAFGQEPACARNCSWNRCDSVPCLQLDGLSVERVLSEIGRIQSSTFCASGSGE